MARTVIIGDIHGCHDELCALLDAVAPAADDRIIALGDIVDRGPETERVLEFFRDTPGALSIMGNHERKHVRAAQDLVKRALSQEIVRAQLEDRYAGWLEFMATFPRHLELPEVILVHGFFEPGVPLEQQRDTVVIGTLTGESYMHANHPDWVERYDGAKPLVVAHHDYLRTGAPLVHEGRFYAIDTGCVYGRALTALVLPDFRTVSVPARETYWSRIRSTHLARLAPRRDETDLEWDTLEAIASTHGANWAPADRRTRCQELAQRCAGLIGPILAAVQERSAAIIADLSQAEEWDRLDERKRAARYACVVDRHPAADLLYGARRGHLNEEFIKLRLRTQRALVKLAQQLGVDTPPAEGPDNERVS